MTRISTLSWFLLAAAFSVSYGANLPSSHQPFSQVHPTESAEEKPLVHAPAQSTDGSPSLLTGPVRRVRRSTTSRNCRDCSTSRLRTPSFYSSKRDSSRLSNDFVGSSDSSSRFVHQPQNFGGVGIINRPIYGSVSGFYQRPTISQPIISVGAYYPGTTLVSGGLIPSSTIISSGSLIGGNTLVQPGILTGQQLTGQQAVLVQQPGFGFREDSTTGKYWYGDPQTSADLPPTASNNVVDSSQQQQLAPTAQSDTTFQTQAATSENVIAPEQTIQVQQMPQGQQVKVVDGVEAPSQPQQQQFQQLQPQQFQLPSETFPSNQRFQQPQQLMPGGFYNQQQQRPPMGYDGIQDGGMQQPIGGGGCGIDCGGGGLGAGGLGGGILGGGAGFGGILGGLSATLGVPNPLLVIGPLYNPTGQLASRLQEQYTVNEVLRGYGGLWGGGLFG